MKKTLGTMISDTMLNRGITQKELCAGLCSSTAFSRYVNGERHIDRLLLSVILQRLGKSADKFATLLSEEEYVYFAWKQKVCVAQLHKDWQRVETLLQEKEAFDRTCNDKLQEQFHLIMKAIAAEKLNENHTESLRLLEKAILLTVPGFEKGISKHMLLGVQEINAILLWQRLQSDKQIAMKTLEKLVQYTENHFEDMQEKSKVYPKVVAQYLPLLYEREKYMECVVLAKKALEIMTSTGFTAGIETALTVYVDAAEKLGLAEEVRKPKVQLQAWRELMLEINSGTDEADDGLYQSDVSQEIVLLHEMIYLNRKEQGFSQEKLSEDICEPESLSRIETGKHTPNQRTYKAIAQKLSLPEERYFSAIETDDFEVLDARWELEQLVIRRDYVAAKRKLIQLKKVLNLNVVQNFQYIEEIQYIIDKRTNALKEQERVSRLIMILEKSMKEHIVNGSINIGSNKFWKHAFSEREMSILLQVADVMWSNQEKLEAVSFLEKMLNFYLRSAVSPEFHYRIVILIMQRLSAYNGLLGNWDRQLKHSERGIQMAVECGNRMSVGLFLNNKANALEHLGKKEASLKYYKLAFYISELFKAKGASVSKQSYEKSVGTEVDWY